MVHGLDKFRDHFKDYKQHYILIGGSACTLLMDEMGLTFRATKDLDVVIVLDLFNESFLRHFHEFIEEGGYELREVGQKTQFYRFTHPANHLFPKQIELFCKASGVFNLKHQQRCIPILVDDNIVSLSAILLESHYYDLLLSRKRELDDISMIDLETMILFKIKAYLDNHLRRSSGERVDLVNVNKHRADILKLILIVSKETKLSLDDQLKNDVIAFIEKIRFETPNLSNIGLINVSIEDLILVLEQTFLSD